MKLRLILLLLVSSVIFYSNVSAQRQQPKLLIPIGGGYSDTYAGFSETVVARAANNLVKILVLPIAYATNPETITQAELSENMLAAEKRRYEIEEACKRAAPRELECIATLAPIFVHSDAENPEMLQFFPLDLTAVFILGGDQTIAMQVISGTPIEVALAEAYERGAIIAGTSAGCGLQSANMLGGYSLNFNAGNSLEFGAPDIWNTPEKHGLLFGIQHAILDQHFYQRSRFGRLLNAITLPDVPHIGVGVDAYTGVLAPDGERLENVFGRYTVTILDAETYHAANNVQYRGIRNLLSIRNILVHLLSPGDASYDLKTRQHSLAAAPMRIERTFEGLILPDGAGPLILAGNLSKSLDHNLIITHFVNLSGGENANILIIAAGYPTDGSAQRAADNYKAALPIHAQTLVISKDTGQPPNLPQGITGIIFIGNDQSRIRIESLPPIKDAWLSGVSLLADDAAAAVTGAHFSAHAPTPDDAEGEETATQKSFIQGNTTILPGLGLLDLSIEPQVIGDNRWGRLFSLAYNQPDLLAIGLADDTALAITASSATVLGDNVVFFLDLRYATLDLGSNQGFVIANGLIDVFAPDDLVAAQPADVESAPIHAPTPALPTPTIIPSTSTPTPTVTSSPSPTLPTTEEPSIEVTTTKTPRSTSTPPVIPPSANPHSANIMIAISLLLAVIVFLGAWLNRQRMR